MQGIITASLLLLCIAADSAAGEGALRYRIDTPEKIAVVRTAHEARLAPLLPGVLTEAGMPAGEAAAFLAAHPQRMTMVEGDEAQAEADLARAREIMAALPPHCAAAFDRLSCQWNGPVSFWRDDVADMLGLDAAQRARVEEACVRCAELQAPANRPDFSYEMSPAGEAAFNRRTLEIENERDRALLALLGPEQLARWEAFKGPPSPSLHDFRIYCARNSVPKGAGSEERMNAIRGVFASVLASDRAGGVALLGRKIRSGDPMEKDAALYAVEDARVAELLPAVIAAVTDATPAPRYDDTGWGSIGRHAAWVAGGFILREDRGWLENRDADPHRALSDICNDEDRARCRKTLEGWYGREREGK